MKSSFPAALIFGLLVAVPAFAAEKGKKPSGKKPSTVPGSSKMIVIPPPSDPAATGGQAPKLISSEMSGLDLRFFTTVVDAGRFQSYLVNLLKTRAQSDQIKALATALSSTQEQENNQIARLAAAKGWTVSIEPTAAQTAFGAALEKQAGADFDKAVLDKVISASKESVSAYETAGQSTDEEIKRFSEQMLPLSKEKLMLVERMTGAGKAASQLFRTGAPPKPAPAVPAPVAAPPQPPASTPKPYTGDTPPPITPPKPKAAPKPAATATPAPAATPAAKE